MSGQRQLHDWDFIPLEIAVKLTTDDYERPPPEPHRLQRRQSNTFKSPLPTKYEVGGSMESLQDYLPKKPRLSYDSSLQRRTFQASWKIKARARLFRKAAMFKGFTTDEFQKSNGSFLRSIYSVNHKEMQELKLEKRLFEILSHRCSRCSQIFSLETHFNKHMQFCHTYVFSPGRIGQTTENENRLRDPFSHMLVCPWCPLLCSSMPALQKHLPNCREAGRQKVKAEILKRFPCPECPTQFATLKNLLFHLQSHYVGDILCNPCNKSFLNLKSLSKHLQTCTSKEFYKCSDCGKPFINASHLMKHLPRCRSYTQCLKCAEAVIERRSCMDHMTMHLNAEWSRLGLELIDGVLHKVPKKTELSPVTQPLSGVSLYEVSLKTGKGSTHKDIVAQSPAKLSSSFLKANSTSSSKIERTISESSVSQTFGSLNMLRLDLSSSSDEEDHYNVDPINFDDWSCDEMSESADDNFPVFQQGVYEIENNRGDSEFVDEPEISCSDLSYNIAAAEDMTDPLMPDLEVQQNPLREAQNCMRAEEVPDPPMPNLPIEDDILSEELSVAHSLCSLATFDGVTAGVREPAVVDLKKNTSHLFTPAANDSDLMLTVVNVEGGANLFNWDDDCDTNNEVIPESSETRNENVAPSYPHSFQTSSNSYSYLNTESKSDGNEDGDSGIDATDDQDSNRDKMEEFDAGRGTNVPGTTLPIEASELSPIADTANEEMSCHATEPCDTFLRDEILVPHESSVSSEVFISSSVCDNEVVVGCPVESPPKEKKPYSVVNEHSYAVPEGQLLPWFKHQGDKPKAKSKTRSVKPAELSNITSTKRKKKKSLEQSVPPGNAKINVDVQKVSEVPDLGKNRSNSKKTRGSNKKIKSNSDQPLSKKNESASQQPFDSANDGTNKLVSEPANLCGNEITGICSISVNEASSEVFNNSAANCSIDIVTPQMLVDKPEEVETNKIKIQSESNKTSTSPVSGLKKCVKMSTSCVPRKVSGLVKWSEQTMIPLIKNGRTIAYLRAAPTLVPIKTAPSDPMVVAKNSQVGNSCTTQPKAMPPKPSMSSVLGETKSNPLPSTSKNSSQTIVILPDVKAPDQSEKVSPNVRHSGDLFNNSQVLCNQLMKENLVTEKRTEPPKSREEAISSSRDPCRNNTCQNATDKAMLKVYRRERSMLSRGFKQIAISFPHRKDSSGTNSLGDVGDGTYSSTVALSVDTQETQATPDTCVPKEGFSGQVSRKCSTVLKESVNSEVQKSVQPESSSSDNLLMFIVASDGSLVPYPNFKPLPPSVIAGSKENMPPTGSVSITHSETFNIDSEVLEVTGGKQSDLVHEELQEESVTSTLQTRCDALQHSSVDETDDKGAAQVVSLNDAHKCLSEHSPPEIKETPKSNSVEIIRSEQSVAETSKPESVFSVLDGKCDGGSIDKCYVDELHGTEYEASGPPVLENMKIVEKEALPAAANLSECLNEDSHDVMQTDVFDSALTVLNGKQDISCVDDKINKSSSRSSPIQICHMELCSDSSNEEPESSNIQGNDKTDGLMKIHDLNQGEANSQVHMDLRSDERSYWPDSDHEMSSGSSNIDDSESTTPPNECSDLFQNAVDELLLVNLLKSLKLTTYDDKNKIVKPKRRKNPRYLYWTNILYSRKLMKEMKRLKRRRFGREGLLKDTSRFNCKHCTQWFYFKADLEHHICLKFLIQNKFTSERFDRFFDSKDTPQKGENDNTNINLSLTPSVHDAQPNPAPSKATSSMSLLETFFSMKLQTKRRCFTCQKCQQNFKSFSALHDHKTEVHDEKLSLKCHICGKEFSRLQKLAVHFAKSHRANSKAAESKEDTVTDTLSAEISNIEEGSGPESSSKSESFIPTETGSLDPIIKDGNHSKDPTKIDISDPATDNEAECCKICNKTFSANGGLKSHMNQAHATIYKCPICLRRFTYLTTMKTHFMKHFGSTSNSVNVSEAPESTPVINGCNEDDKEVSNTHSAKKDVETVPLTTGTHISLSEDKRDMFSLDTKSQEEPIEESSIILETTGKTKECHTIAEGTGVSNHPEGAEDPQRENVDKQKRENSNVPSEVLGVALHLQDENSIGKRALDDLGTTDPSQGKKRRKCKWIISSPEKNKTTPETVHGPAESGSEKLVISLSKVKRSRHKCQDCDKSFKKQHHLALHRLEVHTNGPFTCPVCHEEQSDTVQLQIHLEKCDDIPNNKNLTRGNKEKTCIESNPSNKNLLTVSVEIGVVSPPVQTCVDNFDDAFSNKEVTKGNNEEACREASPNKAISFAIPSRQSCDSKVNKLNDCETHNLAITEEKSEQKDVSEDGSHSHSHEQNVNQPVKTSAFSSTLHITGKRRSKKNARYLEFEDSLRAFKSRQLKRDVWHCKECPMKYISKGLLERHNVKVHGAPSRFNCPHCGKIFTDARNLRFHTKKKHANNKSLLSNIVHDSPPQSDSMENADATSSLESEASATLVVSEGNADAASPVHPKENADPATPGDSEENSKTAIPLDIKINPDMVSSEFSNDAHGAADSMVSVAGAPGVVDNSGALMPSPSQLNESMEGAGSSSVEQPTSGPAKELVLQRPHNFECSECKMKYMSEVILQKHKIRVHGAPCKFYCRHCKIVFAEARSLSYHYKNTHRRKRDRKQKILLANCTAITSVQSESSERASVVTPKSETSTEPASSDVAKKSGTSQLVESQAPVSSSALTRPHTFECSECKMKYMSEVILQKHKIRVHGAPCKFYCRHCKIDFAEARSLSYHYKNTHRRKRDRKKKGLRSKQTANTPAQSEPTKLVGAVTPLDSQADPVSSEAVSDVNTGSGRCVMDAVSSDVVKKSETLTSNSSQLTESLAPVSLSTAEQAVTGPPKDSVSSLAHKGSQPKRGDWPCNECKLKFRNKGCLERHNIKKHGATCNFNCPYCKNIFTDARSLRFHHKTKHAKKKWLLSDSPATTSTQPKSPEIAGAGAGTSSDSEANAHVASSDVVKKSETLTSNSSQLTESLAPVSLSTAEQTVTTPPKDRVSSLAPDDSQPRRGDWPCDECKLKFRNKGCLERHNIKKHGAACKFNCPYCKNIFTDARSLRFHHKTKHAKKKWLLSDSPATTSTQPKSAEIAGAGTPSDSEANAQVAPSTVNNDIHTSVDSQQCVAAVSSDVIDKSETLNSGSSQLEALDPVRSQVEQPSTESPGDVRRSSISIVNGKKFRKCKHCQKPFKRGIDLKKHYRIKHHKRALVKYESKASDEDVEKESGESLAPCGDSVPEMSRTSIDSSEIGADEEGEYKCTDCPLTYRTFSCLKRHRILIHAEPASHYCDICGKGFSYPHSLKNHMMTHSRHSQNVIKSKRSERRVKCFSCEGPCDNEDHNSRSSNNKPVTEQETVDSMNTVDEPVASGAVDEVAVTVSSPDDSTVPNSMMQNSLSAICAPVTATNSCSVGSTENVTDHALGQQVHMALNPGNSETKVDAISSAVHWNQPALNSFPAPPFDPVPASASVSGFNTSGPAPQAGYSFWSGAPISPAPFLTNGSGAAAPDTHWAPPFEEMKSVNACSLCGLCLPSWYALQEHHYRTHSHPYPYPNPNMYSAQQPQQEPYPAPQTVPIPWLSPWQTAAQHQSVAQNVSPIKQHDASASSFAELTSLSNAHCSVCGLGFPTLSALQEHYATHMAASAPPMSPFPYAGFY